MNLKSKVQAILSRTEYATIATVDENGSPWNAPVYVAYDDHFNFYWGSYKESQHSKNIRNNPKVFLVIYNSTARPGTGEGIYVKATCGELTGPQDIAFAHKLIQKRRYPIPYWKLEQFQTSNAPIKLYRAAPQKIWTNGDTKIDGTYIDVRVEAAEI
jgi:uncharacterized protein YhbP (UPF0306 family)